MTSTSADWLTARRAELDRIGARLDELHGPLTVPDNPAVTIGVNSDNHLRITVGTAVRPGRGPDRVVTGYQLAATMAPSGVIVIDITSCANPVDNEPLSRFRLARTSTAQTVIDRLAAHVGTQCVTCGQPDDHDVSGVLYCADCCPECNDQGEEP